MKSDRQTTLAGEISLSGPGLHTGREISMGLAPARAGTGVVFIRTDLANGSARERQIRARHDRVCGVELSTTIANASGARVSTIEHLMAALIGCGIDNIEIRLNGPEVPVLDGSAALFCAAIREAGVRTSTAARTILRVCKPVRVADGDKWAELLPGDSFELDVTIDFEASVIGRQSIRRRLTPEIFARDFAPARTFGFLDDLARLHANKLALGASLENTLVFDHNRILNPEGARFADECVRHKALDALGDLALAGAPIRGRFHSYKSGHALNNRLLHALFKTPGAVRRETQARELSAAPIRSSRSAALSL